MEPSQPLIPRKAYEAVVEALADTRVVVLTGSRQAGKSTLAKIISSSTDGSETRYLDEERVRNAATEDPAGFVRNDHLLVIDEVQRVPELILAIKHEVDLDPRPGRFLLTGSARLFALQSIPDSLPGRTETIETWPLSQGEIERIDDRFVEAAFEDGANISVPDSPLHRLDYVERALRGGFPEAVRRTDSRRRARFFESYTTDLINKDVKQLSDIERPADLRRVVNTIAASMASPVMTRALANRLNLAATTVKRYVDLLELVYFTHRVPAWSTNLTTRAVAAPKLVVTDSGLAGHLTGMSLKRAKHPTAPVGPLIENFVLSELARQLTWTAESVRLYHYRDRDQREVDVVLEHASGEVVAIEIKAAETVRTEDFRHIRYLADRLGDQFRAGFVLYSGGQPLPFGERLRALPIASLWTA